MTIEEQLQILEAYKEGKKVVYRQRNSGRDYGEIKPNHKLNFCDFEYEVEYSVGLTEIFNGIKSHGDWVVNSEGEYFKICRLYYDSDENTPRINVALKRDYTLNEFFSTFVWADDNSPCWNEYSKKDSKTYCFKP